MSQYANQQTIKIKNEDNIVHEQHSGKMFLGCLDWDPLLDVMEDLAPSEFKLWLYLWKWRGKEKGYEFSPADIDIQIGISESTTRRIKTELIKKKYLVKTSENKYDFIPYPEGTHERAELIRAEKIMKHSRLSG